MSTACNCMTGLGRRGDGGTGADGPRCAC